MHKRKPASHPPGIRRASPLHREPPSASPAERPAGEKEERDLDGYVDAQGHPQPHQSPLEASFEDGDELAWDEASQAGAALEDLRDL